MPSPTTPVRSALAKQFLGLLPETLPPDERVNGALIYRDFPGGTSWQVLDFLSHATLKNHWDRNSAEQTARLQTMVTKAIGGDYRDWTAFLKDLHPYLADFGYARFVKGKLVKPLVTAAESEDSRA